MTVSAADFSAKRHSRIIDARLALKRAEKHIKQFPGASATVLIADLRSALQGLLDEVGGSQ